MTNTRKFLPMAPLLASLLLLAAASSPATATACPADPPAAASTSSPRAIMKFGRSASTQPPARSSSAHQRRRPVFQPRPGGNPAGTYLYVADSATDVVNVYSISSTGVLSQINGSPFTVGVAPGGNATAAGGLAVDSTQQISSMSPISPTTSWPASASTVPPAALTSLGAPLATGAGPVRVAISDRPDSTSLSTSAISAAAWEESPPSL